MMMLWPVRVSVVEMIGDFHETGLANPVSVLVHGNRGTKLDYSENTTSEPPKVVGPIGSCLFSNPALLVGPAPNAPHCAQGGVRNTPAYCTPPR
ncbi:hypothetical protein AVEN_94109-1 [Araneus ventricosus]|uniref:Uncharacterized protein n=1 Tax=Araneus ventricosus TaxID=182803 RepID=A0A4Y2MRE1_ARAVE|nr:hypothetical protein AVEN_94109-1 [Araneus ventricosus]